MQSVGFQLIGNNHLIRSTISQSAADLRIYSECVGIDLKKGDHLGPLSLLHRYYACEAVGLVAKEVKGALH